MIAVVFICLATVAPTGDKCAKDNAIREFSFQTANLMTCMHQGVQRAAQEVEKMKTIENGEEVTFRIECEGGEKV